MKLMKFRGSIKKHNQFVVKLAVSVLLICLGLRFLFSQSGGEFKTSSLNNNFIEKTVENDKGTNSVSGNGNQVPINEGNEDQMAKNGSAEESSENGDDEILKRDYAYTGGKCDIFTGDWIANSKGPSYTNETCSWIEDHQNCMKNGRPDTGYLYWKWRPRDCEIPQFNEKLFLEKMRNKSWALIGDSITRNHVQSLLCMLSKVEQPILVYHDEDYKSRRWHFPSHNFTISVIWSPFLTKAAIFEDMNGVSSADIQLHLDKLDPNWTDLYPNLDYMMFSSGKWFVKAAIYYENDAIIGCFNCSDINLTKLQSETAYRKIIKRFFEFILASNHKGMVIYRSSTPDHFENGDWSTGGKCERTGPGKEGEFQMKKINKYLRRVELQEFEKAKIRALEKGINLKFIDVLKLSMLRPDGHPGLFRHFHPLTARDSNKLVRDCLHWCLPGPIDAWNDLIMEMVING